MGVATQAAADSFRLVELDVVLAAFEATAESLLLVEDDHILLVNPACVKLFGCEQAALVGQPFSRFFPPKNQFCCELFQSPPSGGHTRQCEHPSCELALRRPDGGEVRVAVHCTRFVSSNRALVLAALHEVRRAEVALMIRDDELRFRTIFEGAAIGIASCTLDGRIMEANPALSKMLGYGAEELIGVHAREFCPGDFQRHEVFLRELVRGERDAFAVEQRYPRKDGSYRWGHLTVSLVRSAGGAPAFLVAMVEDTTERRRAEEQLREAEKMEVIGRLAGGVAHDFNNLLTGILLYCDLLLHELDPENRPRQHVEEIRMACEHGAALTQQLLAIARKHVPQPHPILLNEMVASTENLLRRLIGEHIELLTILGSDLGPVLADQAQMRQVILNLALNARDAMPQGGRITVRTQGKTIPGDSRPGVALSVEDTGCGMDAPTRARLFEPFFTTKQPGCGTGLGLATVQRIIKEAGGVIAVESVAGRGTQIEVLLPASLPTMTRVAEANAPAAIPHTIPHEDATILLVGDDASARKSMHRILRYAGYRVLEASSGKRALAVFAGHSSQVDLLVADGVMPGMGGLELVEKLRRQRPDLKVLLISGYQDASAKNPGGAPVALIRKPFAGAALIEKIGEVLNSKGEPQC
jgi:two-component system, cell cycle sensor histidine kinase and response regulator CckA